ncbi:MAG: ATP-binding cassette domain-containing protein [Actinomycetota bacterium]
MTASIIETHALTKVYPTGLKAVDGLDLEVREGEIFGLLGPNGAGKTTTVGMLTTRVVPTSGTALIGGVDVVQHPTVAKQLIGVVSQQNTLDRSVTVWENLYFHGRYFGLGARAAKQAADDSLEKFRLTDRASADVATLSGGMAQRLMVARSILHRPPMLFLDEPTAGLDPQSRLALWEILGELHKEGQTILLTTHYMEEADQLCDRLAVMDHGHLLALDSPAALKRSVEADTEIRVTADGNLDALAKHLEDFDGAITSRVLDDIVQVTVKGSTGVLPRIVDHAEKGGFAITDLSINEPTLETVFIELTGKDLRE